MVLMHGCSESTNDSRRCIDQNGIIAEPKDCNCTSGMSGALNGFLVKSVKISKESGNYKISEYLLYKGPLDHSGTHIKVKSNSNWLKIMKIYRAGPNGGSL